jgi:4-amino-4-deoxychorismate lyase
MIISVNGCLLNEREALVSAYDHGFLYGIGVFETFRTYKGRPFLLKEHLDRLEDGCRQLGIHYQPVVSLLRRQIEELLAANNLPDAYIRLTVTAGEDVLGLPAGEYAKPTVLIYIKPLPEADSSIYLLGKPLQLLALPRNTPEGPHRLKSLHYMNNILAKRELNSYPWAKGAEGALLTGDGYLAEGIVSNIFFVRQEELFTPSLDTGILGGITRTQVIDLAEKLELSVKQGMYRWESVERADEVFVTNSIQEIVPITKLFDTQGTSRQVGDGQPGVWTRRLLGQYRQLTGA